MGGIHSRRMWTASRCWPTCAVSVRPVTIARTTTRALSGTMLLHGLSRPLSVACARRGSVCPAGIHESLELPRKQLLKLLNDGPEMPFAAGLASFIESGSHNAETALSFCQGYFAPFQNADMAAVTSVEELRFPAVFKRPTVVILEISQHDLDQQRPLLNLLFSQLFREAARFSKRRPAADCRCR